MYGWWDGLAPVQQQKDDAHLRVVGTLKDCEVDAAHEPVKAGCEAAPNGAELLHKPHSHSILALG